MDLAYAAGIVDGEGCFNVGRCRTSFIPRILVVNTDERLGHWLSRTFGGDVKKTVVKNKPNWKPRYTWRLSNSRALNLAESLMPYLKLKKAQATVFCAWRDTQETEGLLVRRKMYEVFKERIAALNRKGRR